MKISNVLNRRRIEELSTKLLTFRFSVPIASLYDLQRSRELAYRRHATAIRCSSYTTSYQAYATGMDAHAIKP